MFEFKFDISYIFLKASHPKIINFRVKERCDVFFTPRKTGSFHSSVLVYFDVIFYIDHFDSAAFILDYFKNFLQLIIFESF